MNQFARCVLLAALTVNNPVTSGRIIQQATGATPRIWQFAVKYNF
jgi:hypothetical protein